MVRRGERTPLLFGVFWGFQVDMLKHLSSNFYKYQMAKPKAGWKNWMFDCDECCPSFAKSSGTKKKHSNGWNEQQKTLQCFEQIKPAKLFLTDFPSKEKTMGLDCHKNVSKARLESVCYVWANSERRVWATNGKEKKHKNWLKPTNQTAKEPSTMGCFDDHRILWSYIQRNMKTRCNISSKSCFWETKSKPEVSTKFRC